VALQGSAFAHFMVALILLGVGWNFMFVGATTMLTTTLAPSERVRAQALNDAVVFGSVTLTAVGAGVIHHLVGWAVLNIATLPPVVVALAALAWLARRRPALRPQPPAG
jgi:MFS family permease